MVIALWPEADDAWSLNWHAATDGHKMKIDDERFNSSAALEIARVFAGVAGYRWLAAGAERVGPLLVEKLVELAVSKLGG